VYSYTLSFFHPVHHYRTFRIIALFAEMHKYGANPIDNKRRVLGVSRLTASKKSVAFRALRWDGLGPLDLCMRGNVAFSGRNAAFNNRNVAFIRPSGTSRSCQRLVTRSHERLLLVACSLPLFTWVDPPINVGTFLCYLHTRVYTLVVKNCVS
jgi:hypothetical protein